MPIVKPRVVISAGHGLGSRHPGQYDPGAANEADVVRGIALNVVSDLRALAYRGMAADMRDRGLFSLADDDAHEFDADVFLELHLNAGGGQGTETFVGTVHDTRDKKLAILVQRKVVAALDTVDRGVKTGSFAVIKQYPDMASALAELYFVDSKLDRAKAAKHPVALELAILNAVLAFCGWREVKSRPRLWGPVRKSAYRPF